MVTVTNKVGNDSSTNQEAMTTAAATPVAGDLVVAVFARGHTPGTTQNAGSLVASANGLTFSRVAVSAEQTYLPGAADDTTLRLEAYVADQFVGGSPASMTLTHTATIGPGGAAINAHGASWWWFTLQGMLRAGPAAVRQVALAYSMSAGAPVFTFGSNVKTENPTAYKFVSQSKTSSTAASGWTEAWEFSVAAPDFGGEAGFRASGHTGNTITVGTSKANHVGIALEFDTSAPSSANGWGIPV